MVSDFQGTIGTNSVEKSEVGGEGSQLQMFSETPPPPHPAHVRGEDGAAESFLLVKSVFGCVFRLKYFKYFKV